MYGPDERVVSYAQNREDVILAGFFPNLESGTYVDIGAQEPVYDSVTKYFYNLGWSGVNVEPNPVMYKKLKTDRPRDINLNVGISDKPGELMLRVYDQGTGLSTFSSSMKRGYDKRDNIVTHKHHDVSVRVITLLELFETQQLEHVHFMKIDVEGFEYEVLKGNNWKKYRPEVICIEANHIVKDWHNMLKEAGYEQVFFDGLNEYFIAKEATQRARDFSYVQAILGRPIISLKWNHRLEELYKENGSLKAQQVALRRLNEELSQEVDRVHEYARQQRRLRGSIKNLVLAIDAIITVHLNKYAGQTHYYPSLHIAGIERTDAATLLGAIHQGDVEALGKSPKLRHYFKRSIAQSVLWIYTEIRYVVFLLVKKCWHGLRRVQGGRHA